MVELSQRRNRYAHRVPISPHTAKGQTAGTQFIRSFVGIAPYNDAMPTSTRVRILATYKKNVWILPHNLRGTDIINYFIYIKGVKNYEYKQISGFFPGFNMIVVKPNSSDELRFVGFGPGMFNEGSITFDELRKILVNGYNADHSEETNKFIIAYKKKDIVGFAGIPKDDERKEQKADLTDMLKDDKIDEDSSIIGLQLAIRLNPDKLDTFINRMMEKNAWYDMELSEDFVYSVEKIPQIIIAQISSENADSTFDNYNPNNNFYLFMYIYYRGCFV